MKLLYIACGSGSDPTIGGSLTRTTEIARRIQKDNTVYFLTSSGGRKATEKIFSNDAIFEIKTNVSESRKGRGYLVSQLWSYFLILIKSFFIVGKLPEVDLVYLDSDGLWDIVPALLYKRRYPKVKLVSMNHVMIGVSRENVKTLVFSLINGMLQNVSYFFIGRYTDVIFVNDTHEGFKIRDRLSKGKCTKKFYYVHNGVDVNLIEQVLIQEKVYDACFLGYLRPSKGLYDIVPIWQGVCKERRDAKLLIIGSMLFEYRNYLEKQIENNALQNNIVIIESLTNKHEVFKRLKQSKIFISASHKEGWSMAIMECLASGLPGVVWDLPVYEGSVKDGVIKVRLYDVSEFAKQILRLFSDGALMENLKKRAIDYARQCDWDVIAKKELEIFQEVLAG